MFLDCHSSSGSPILSCNESTYEARRRLSHSCRPDEKSLIPISSHFKLFYIFVKVAIYRGGGGVTDLEPRPRIVVYIVDAHLVRNSEATESNVFSVQSLVSAGRNERISLSDNRQN